MLEIEDKYPISPCVETKADKMISAEAKDIIYKFAQRANQSRQAIQHSSSQELRALAHADFAVLCTAHELSNGSPKQASSASTSLIHFAEIYEQSTQYEQAIESIASHGLTLAEITPDLEHTLAPQNLKDSIKSYIRQLTSTEQNARIVFQNQFIRLAGKEPDCEQFYTDLSKYTADFLEGCSDQITHLYSGNETNEIVDQFTVGLRNFIYTKYNRNPCSSQDVIEGLDATIKETAPILFVSQQIIDKFEADKADLDILSAEFAPKPNSDEAELD